MKIWLLSLLCLLSMYTNKANLLWEQNCHSFRFSPLCTKSFIWDLLFVKFIAFYFNYFTNPCSAVHCRLRGMAKNKWTCRTITSLITSKTARSPPFIDPWTMQGMCDYLSYLQLLAASGLPFSGFCIAWWCSRSSSSCVLFIVSMGLYSLHMWCPLNLIKVIPISVITRLSGTCHL